MTNNNKGMDTTSIQDLVNRQAIEGYIRKCIEEEVQKKCTRQTNPSIMTVNQIASYLGFAKVTIYKKVRENSMPFFRVGKKVLFRKDEIDLWLGKYRVQTIEEFIDGVESKYSH